MTTSGPAHGFGRSSLELIHRINSSGRAGPLFTPTRRRLTRITTKNAAGVALLDSVYSRDEARSLVAIIGLTQSERWSYVFDDLERLISAINVDEATLTETASPRQASREFARCSRFHRFLTCDHHFASPNSL